MINPIHDGPFRGSSQMEGKKTASLYILLHTSQNDETWHSYTLPKEDRKKYVNHVTHRLSSADIRMLYRKLANFAMSRTLDIDCILVHNF